MKNLLNCKTSQSIKKCLSENPNELLKKDYYGNTIIHSLVINNKYEPLEELLKMSLNALLINSKNSFGNTPIYYAKNISIIKLLLKYKSNPFITNNNKEMPYITNPLIKEVFDKIYLKI